MIRNLSLLAFSCMALSANASAESDTNRANITLSDSEPFSFDVASGKQTLRFDRNNRLIQTRLAAESSRRYLIELADLPIASYRNDLHKNLLNRPYAKGNANSQQIKSMVVSHKQEIQYQQDEVWALIKGNNLATNKVRSFNTVINGFVIEANEYEAKQIARLPGVKSITEQKKYSKSLADSVPLINAQALWETTDASDNPVLGDGINVAIVDTGIDYTHPSLGGCLGEGCKVVAGYDFVNLDDDPMDGDGHGTHVAGIVAASGDALKGVAPNARLHAYKVLDDNGYGFDTDIIASIEYAADPDDDPTTDDAVDIINMSLGGGGDADDPLSRATDAAVDAGILVVVAAGNGGEYEDIQNSSPASAKKAITVASSTKSDELSWFSSKGILDLDGGLKPEITAPGSDIVSTFLNHETSSLSGTSMAAPHVAGAAALVMQLYPNLSVTDIKAKLMASTIDLGLDPFAQGTGRLDLSLLQTQDVLVEQGMVNLGRIDNEAESYSAETSLKIKNNGQQEAVIEINLPQNLPSGIDITLAEDNLILAPGQQVSVAISASIADTSLIDVPSNGAMVYFDDLLVNSAQQSLRVPVVIEKSYLLTLSHNSPSATWVSIQNAEQGVYRYAWMASGESAVVRVPDVDLYMLADFGWLTPADLGADHLVQSATVFAYSIEQISVTTDAEYAFDFNVIDTFYGIQHAVDQDGNTMTSEELDLLAFNAGVYGEKAGSGLFAFGFEHMYLGVGQIDETTEISFSIPAHVQLASLPEDEAHFYSVSYASERGVKESVLIDLDMATDQVNHFSMPFQLLSTERPLFDIMAYADDGSGVGTSFDVPGDTFVMHTPAAYKEVGAFHLGLGEYDEEGFFQNVVSTGKVKIDEQGDLYKVGYWGDIQLELGAQNMDMTSMSTFWNAGIDGYNGQLTLFPLSYGFWPAYQIDTLLNEYSEGLNTTLNWYCDGEVFASEDVSASFNSVYELPELACAENALELIFNNYLSGQQYQSSLRHNIQFTDGFYVDRIEAIYFEKNGAQVIDQTFNKINSLIKVKAHPALLETISVELKLGESEWQALATSIDESGETLTAPIQLIEGAEIGHLRLTYGFNQENIQTLNGFFMLGTESGSDRDVDDDGIPNEEDLDNDNDGYPDTEDAFKYDSSEWLDTDSDGLGNNRDEDDDNDGYLDFEDAFPLDATEWLDTDSDGIGNNADEDDDNDGVADEFDVFPLDANEWEDTDADGVGNNADGDDDNDGYNDDQDAFPLDASEWLDTDADGIGNNADEDDDNDGVNDEQDAFPLDASESIDTDADGIGNNADTDDDNDGVLDSDDAFPTDASRSQALVSNSGSSSGSGGGSVFLLVLLTTILLSWRWANAVKSQKAHR